MTKHHLFCWDLPANPRLSFAMAAHYGNFAVTPMSYAASVTCRKYLPDHCVLLENVISSNDRIELLATTNGIMDRFYSSLSNQAPAWCAAESGNALLHYLYYSLLAHALLKRILCDDANVQVIHYKPLGLSLMPNHLRSAYQCFDTVIAAHTYAAQESRHETFHRYLSKTVATMQQKLKHARKDESPDNADVEEVDLLFVALEESDRRNQTPLVARMHARNDVSLRWLTVEGDNIGLSLDEKKLGHAELDLGVVHEAPRHLGGQIGGLSRYGRWHKYHYNWWVYTALREACGEFLPPLVVWRIASLLAEKALQLNKRHHAVQRLMMGYKPKVMVVNSYLQAMRSVQLEAERRGIPTVLLPHGISYALGRKTAWCADAVGRFGLIEQQILQEHFPDRKSTFHSIGGGHLGQMAMLLSAVEAHWPEGPVKILFPTTIPEPFLPLTPSEVTGDAGMLVMAGIEAGAITVVRCHPRQKHHNYFDYELMLSEIDSSGWQLSDGTDSLIDSLTACHIVVVSHYSGAVVQALYAPRPIVCWMPRQYAPFSDKILQRFPCRATTQDELIASYRRIQAEPDYRAELLQKQKELLAELVSDPYGDPYAGSEKLVMDTLRQVKKG